MRDSCYCPECLSHPAIHRKKKFKYDPRIRVLDINTSKIIKQNEINCYQVKFSDGHLGLFPESANGKGIFYPKFNRINYILWQKNPPSSDFKIFDYEKLKKSPELQYEWLTTLKNMVL